jgi:hypothetical protein
MLYARTSAFEAGVNGSQCTVEQAVQLLLISCHRRARSLANLALRPPPRLTPVAPPTSGLDPAMR